MEILLILIVLAVLLGWKFMRRAFSPTTKSLKLPQCEECKDPISIKEYHNPKNKRMCDYCRDLTGTH